MQIVSIDEFVSMETICLNCEILLSSAELTMRVNPL